MVSQQEIKEINNYFDYGYIPPKLDYSCSGFKLDWLKLDYSQKKLKPHKEFDLYLENLMTLMTVKDK